MFYVCMFVCIEVRGKGKENITFMKEDCTGEKTDEKKMVRDAMCFYLRVCRIQREEGKKS